MDEKDEKHCYVWTPKGAVDVSGVIKANNMMVLHMSTALAEARKSLRAIADGYGAPRRLAQDTLDVIEAETRKGINP